MAFYRFSDNFNVWWGRKYKKQFSVPWFSMFFHSAAQLATIVDNQHMAVGSNCKSAINKFALADYFQVKHQSVTTRIFFILAQ